MTEKEKRKKKKEKEKETYNSPGCVLNVHDRQTDYTNPVIFFFSILKKFGVLTSKKSQNTQSFQLGK